jgi:UDP-N-acetylglucosamine--N-acetylmuramyl-(pentapeptide) pyrophosphoryl-undecaprenol N-acetylglucosamine transferase
MNRVFLIAGRTGGPFFPLPAIAHNLKNIEPICIGVKGGFEDLACQKRNWKIYHLPETRLTILSFKKEKIRETIKNYLEFGLNILLFLWSLLKSFILIAWWKPKMIYSTGSFLAVPMIYAAKFSNLIGITNTKIVIHQQDPLPGISNRLTANFADTLTCVYSYTKSNFKQFKQSLVIPNPIDTELYDKPKMETLLQNTPLKKFLFVESEKPVMLIFGGGSGSEDINVWTMKNIVELLQKFRIIHLTGILQTKELENIQHDGYIRLTALFEEMPVVMKLADLVLCRAGMASNTELQYLEKAAFLVPLPSTHQEVNAQMVSQYFYILHQKDRPDWMQTISENYPVYFEQIKYPEKQKTNTELEKYYQKLQTLLDN